VQRDAEIKQLAKEIRRF